MIIERLERKGVSPQDSRALALGLAPWDIPHEPYQLDYILTTVDAAADGWIKANTIQEMI